MKLRSALSLALVFALIAAPVFALSLTEARSSGVIGEKLDGYVAAVQPSAEVNALVTDINNKRRQEYAKIAKENGQPADAVAKISAGEIINKLPSGSMYQAADGSWKKR